MIALPETKPVATPEAAMDAILISLLLQVPPGMLAVSDTVDDTHTAGAISVMTGDAFTVTCDLVQQPVGRIYEMYVCPAATPDTIPVTASTAAMLEFLELHVPPADALDNVA